MADRAVTLFLGGDVMLGRGVDQVLPHPGDPALWEPAIRDARRYVELAERVNGPIPRPVPFTWPWGDALETLDRFQPDLRLVNLETSVTRSDDRDPAKGIHYRMSPGNLPALTAARPDVCSLANNHVLDLGVAGLDETLHALGREGILAAGAGRNATDAARPALVPSGDGRIVVFSFGTTSSGVPRNWAATENGPGIALLPDLSDGTAGGITARIARAKIPGDVVVISLHWGSNWGYAVPRDQVRFAHRLIDGGADLVHGHSSHHPRPIEVYRGKLVLYGCGDLVDDYEGISGYERYRDDLRLLYLATLEAATGRLIALRMVPLQAHQMRLRQATPTDRRWLCRILNRTSRHYGTRVDLDQDGLLTLSTSPGGP